MPKILVSACLLGVSCRYDAKINSDITSELNKRGYKKCDIVPICPESMGGLPTPRAPSEIVSRLPLKVVSCDGNDVTNHFIVGAKIAVELAIKNNVKLAILKEKSPSCGVNQVYDGTFTKKLIRAQGFTASQLAKNGIKIISSENLSDLREAKIK